jgi:hypothetical protein
MEVPVTAGRGVRPERMSRTERIIRKMNDVELGETRPAPFRLKDCALAAIATGQRAQNLREMRDMLQVVHPGCIFYHFWDVLLRPGFEEPEYENDFAAWAFRGLHDIRLAERLAVVNPAEFPDVERLRQELIAIIEERLDESEHVPWARTDDVFHFVRSEMVVFDTHRAVSEPAELAQIMPALSVSSVFYHFVDARRREPLRMDDFRAWLMGWGERYEGLVSRLADVDPYFSSLTELRRELATLFSEFFKEGAA